MNATTIKRIALVLAGAAAVFIGFWAAMFAALYFSADWPILMGCAQCGQQQLVDWSLA